MRVKNAKNGGRKLTTRNFRHLLKRTISSRGGPFLCLFAEKITFFLLLLSGTVSIFEAVFFLFFQHRAKNNTYYLVRGKEGKSYVINGIVCSDRWYLCHVLYDRICAWSARCKNKKVEDSYWIESDFGKRIIKCIQ